VDSTPAKGGLPAPAFFYLMTVAVRALFPFFTRGLWCAVMYFISEVFVALFITGI